MQEDKKYNKWESSDNSQKKHEKPQFSKETSTYTRTYNRSSIYKNESAYDTSSQISSTKSRTQEAKTENFKEGVKLPDKKDSTWTTLTPKSEIVFDLDALNLEQQHNLQQGNNTVELVVAVQSAIKQRQELLEEMKIKADNLVKQLKEAKNDKYNAEESLKMKEYQLTKITRDFNEIQAQLNCLRDESNYVKKENENVKLEKNKTNSLYQCALQDLADAKKKLLESEELREKLERRFRLQEEENEHWFKQSEHIENELMMSRETIRSLQKEISELEEQLNKMRTELLNSPSQQETKFNGEIEKLKDKLTNSLEELKREIQKNANQSEEISKLEVFSEKLSQENKELRKILSTTEQQNKDSMQKNSQLQSNLMKTRTKSSQYESASNDLKSQIHNLEKKITELQNENNVLRDEVDDYRKKNMALQDEMFNSEKSLASMRSRLDTMQVQIEESNLRFCDVESTLTCLETEKKSLEQKIKNHEDYEKRRTNDVNRLVSENEASKYSIKSLKENLEMANKNSSEYQAELKSLKNQIKTLEEQYSHQKMKNLEEINILQEKQKANNDYWKNYVEKEISKIKDSYKGKLQKHYEEYSSYIVQSKDSRDNSFASDQNPNELLEEISHLRKQLGESTKKLEETIYNAENSRKSLLNKAAQEQNQLLEQITTNSKSDLHFHSELESKIQKIFSKFMDENNALQKLEAENKKLKEKLEKYKKRNDETKKHAESTNELLVEIDQLKIDLGHSKNVCALTEETCDRLRQDLADCKRKLLESTDKLDFVQNDLINLNKTIGQKNAQIEILNQTVIQLKSKLTEYERDALKIKCQLDTAEHDKIILDKDYCLAKNEVTELRNTITHLRNSKKEITELNEKLNNDLYQQRSEIKSVYVELDSYKEKLSYLQQQYDQIKSDNDALKIKVSENSGRASDNNKDMKDIMEKLIESNKNSGKLQQKITQLTNEYRLNEQNLNNQLQNLSSDITSKRTEVSKLSELFNAEEDKNKKLLDCLNITDGAYCELVRIFDNYFDVLSNEFNFPSKKLAEPTCSDHQACDDSCIYADKLNHIKEYENKLDLFKKLVHDIKKKELDAHKHISKLEQQCDEVQRTFDNNSYSSAKEIEQLNQVIKNHEYEYDQIQQKLINMHVSQCTNNEETSKIINENIEQQKFSLSISEDYNSMRNEIMNYKSKIQSLNSEKRNLESKLNELESTCSISKIKIVSLEGEIESNEVRIKELTDKELEKTDLMKKMNHANNDLSEKLLNSQLEIHKLQQIISEKSKTNQSEDETSQTECTDEKYCNRNHSHNIHSSIANLELEKKLLLEKLEAAQKSEHQSRLNMVSLEEKVRSLSSKLSNIEAEKANLEGWVKHLNQLIRGSEHNLDFSEKLLQDGVFKGENYLSELQRTIASYENQMKRLEKDNNELKERLENISTQQDFTNKHKPEPSSLQLHKISADKDNIEMKYNSLKKTSEEKDIEISNLKNEITALRHKLPKAFDLPKIEGFCNESLSNSELSLDKRVTACVVTYSHKNDSKANNSWENKSDESKNHKSTNHKDFIERDSDEDLNVTSQSRTQLKIGISPTRLMKATAAGMSSKASLYQSKSTLDDSTKKVKEVSKKHHRSSYE